MNVQDHVEAVLIKEQEKRKDRERSGKYNPSSLGRCFRLQYWKRTNEPETNPSDMVGLIKMIEGTIHHRSIQKFLPKKQVEVKIESDHVFGYADWVTEDCVYDFKTTDSWNFKKFWDVPTDRIKENNHKDLLQLGWYAMQLGIAKICLVGVVKGKLGSNSMAYHYFETEELREAVMDEIDTLKDIWKNKELPAAEARAFNGRDCQYCGFKDRCKELENGVC